MAVALPSRRQFLSLAGGATVAGVVSACGGFRLADNGGGCGLVHGSGRQRPTGADADHGDCGHCCE